MKLFQQLLLAPAALGLLAPVAAQAADLNLDGVNKYAAEEQVTSISQFSDVRPTDWAYQALSNLIERYGCVAGYPDGTYKGGRAMTRYEAAALLNACLDRVTEVTDELKRLMKEFEKELAVLKGRVDGLEAKVGELEANQFSTTTKLKGQATFVMGASKFSGDSKATFRTFEPDGEGGEILVGRDRDRSYADIANDALGATTFNYDLRLDFDTSFTGKDLFRTRLRAGNFGGSGFGTDEGDVFDPETGEIIGRTLGFGVGGGNAFATGLSSLEVAFQEPDSPNSVAIDRLFYQFPIGSNFTATVGGRVRQDDMLAMWPSVYPADTVLDFFTVAGAPGTYNLNLGAGAGIWWAKDGFSVSVNYVSANANFGDPGDRIDFDGDGDQDGVCPPGTGGIGTDCANQSFTAQIGYASTKEFLGGGWGVAAAYTYSNGVFTNVGTPLALLGGAASSSINSVGLSGYWQPSESGWIPSISAGWGLNSHSFDNDVEFGGVGLIDGATTQSWYVGLQWADAFMKGNALGMAVGQGTFLTDIDWNSDVDDGPGANDGNYVWEWWYKFQVTDNISVTPALFYLSRPLGQLPTAFGDNKDSLSQFGGLIKTTFKF